MRVMPALHHMVGAVYPEVCLTENPLGQRPPGQEPLPRQRPPGQRPPWTKTPRTETPLVNRQTRVKIVPCPKLRLRAVKIVAYPN